MPRVRTALLGEWRVHFHSLGPVVWWRAVLGSVTLRGLALGHAAAMRHAHRATATSDRAFDQATRDVLHLLACEEHRRRMAGEEARRAG